MEPCFNVLAFDVRTNKPLNRRKGYKNPEEVAEVRHRALPEAETVRRSRDDRELGHCGRMHRSRRRRHLTHWTSQRLASLCWKRARTLDSLARNWAL